MASPADENLDDLIDELEKQLIEEDASVVQVRKAESELSNFLQIRAIEYSEPKLKVSIFDPIRNHQARAGLLAMVCEPTIQFYKARIFSIFVLKNTCFFVFLSFF